MNSKDEFKVWALDFLDIARESLVAGENANIYMMSRLLHHLEQTKIGHVLGQEIVAGCLFDLINLSVDEDAEFMDVWASKCAKFLADAHEQLVLEKGLLTDKLFVKAMSGINLKYG